MTKHLILLTIVMEYKHKSVPQEMRLDPGLHLMSKSREYCDCFWNYWPRWNPIKANCSPASFHQAQYMVTYTHIYST